MKTTKQPTQKQRIQEFCKANEGALFSTDDLCRMAGIDSSTANARMHEAAKDEGFEIKRFKGEHKALRAGRFKHSKSVSKIRWVGSE